MEPQQLISYEPEITYTSVASSDLHMSCSCVSNKFCKKHEAFHETLMEFIVELKQMTNKRLGTISQDPL